MWPLVSPPGVFKARISAGRVRRHASDMRDGHSGLCGGDKMRPALTFSRGTRFRCRYQVVDFSARARVRDTSPKKKKKEERKKRLPRLLTSWRAPERGHTTRVFVRVLPVGG